MADDRLEQAETVLGYPFSDRSLLATALTHPSCVGEHSGAVSYDRLEFLGDAVLGLIVAEHLYRAFPGENEGQLSRRKHSVIAGDILAQTAESLGLADLIMLGKGVREPGAPLHASVLEDALEALVGAVYLDGGPDAAAALCNRVLADRLASSVPPEADVKGRLQELTQSRDGALPEYRITAVSGDPHTRVFTAEVLVAERVIGQGSGRSKQAAEKTAAAAALLAIEAETGGAAGTS